MRQKSDFQEFLKLVREFAAVVAVSVAQVDTVLAQLDTFEHDLVAKRLTDSQAGDECRQARRILIDRRGELLAQDLRRLFKQ